MKPIYCTDLVAWLNSICTVLLVLITAYYAYVNRNLFKLYESVFGIDFRPYFGFESVVLNHNIRNDLNNNPTDRSIQLGLILKNYSKGAIRYEVVEFVASIENKTLHEAKFINKGGLVFPGQVSTYTYDIIHGIPITNIISGIIEYEIRYCFDGKSNCYFDERKLQITFSPSEVNVNYIFL